MEPKSHLAAYPGIDWPGFALGFVEALGLGRNPYSIQTEPHDYMAEPIQTVTQCYGIEQPFLPFYTSRSKRYN